MLLFESSLSSAFWNVLSYSVIQAHSVSDFEKCTTLFRYFSLLCYLELQSKLIELSCYQGWWEQTDRQTDKQTDGLTQVTEEAKGYKNVTSIHQKQDWLHCGRIQERPRQILGDCTRQIADTRYCYEESWVKQSHSYGTVRDYPTRDIVGGAAWYVCNWRRPSMVTLGLQMAPHMGFYYMSTEGIVLDSHQNCKSFDPPILFFHIFLKFDLSNSRSRVRSNFKATKWLWLLIDSHPFCSKSITHPTPGIQSDFSKFNL